MARITGKRGEVYVPTGDGLSISNVALTKNATKTIQGTEYANRFYATSARSAWNKGKNPTVRLQGIIGAPTLSPGTANNTVVLSALKWHKDNSGVQSYTSTQTLTLTRNTAGAQWHMIHIDNTTGSAAVTAGAVSASTTVFSDTWAATAGPAYVDVGRTLVAAVKLTPGAAGVVAVGDITYSLSDGTLIQERSDIPGFAVLPMEGGVLMNEALLGCHTAGAARTLYASYYDQYPLIAKLGDVDAFSLSGTNDTIELEAMGDYSPETDLSGSVKWSGSFSRFYVGDNAMFGMALQRRTAIVRLYPDSGDSTKYYEGAVIISDWGTDVSLGAGVKENVSFTGDGNLELRGV
jgi:hypothetical protein